MLLTDLGETLVNDIEKHVKAIKADIIKFDNPIPIDVRYDDGQMLCDKIIEIDNCGNNGNIQLIGEFNHGDRFYIDMSDLDLNILVDILEVLENGTYKTENIFA
jgi:hypothetical protein